MTDMRAIDKHLRRTGFLCLHAGLLLVMSGFGVMLFTDADSWHSVFSIIRAAFTTYEPDAYRVILDRGVAAGWILLVLAGFMQAFIHTAAGAPRSILMQILRRTSSRLLRTALIVSFWLAALITALLLIWLIYALQASRTAVQTIHVLLMTASLAGYAAYTRTAAPKLRAASDFTVAIMLFTAIFFIVNVYLSRHNRIYDTSSARFYTLEDQTRSLVTSLDKKVKIYVILVNNPNRNGLIYDYTQKLCNQIAGLTDTITFEFVPPMSNKADEILKRHSLSQYMEAIIFECGPRAKLIPVEPSGAPLAVLEEEDVSHPLMNRGLPEIKAYKGENAFYLALNEVTTDRKKEIHFIEGHGERAITEFTAQSLSGLEKELQNLNYSALTTTLRQGEVPVADALVIAGPDRNYLDWEIELISRYLNEKNGSLIYFAEPIYGDTSIGEAGLAPLMAEFGIEVHNDLVVLYSDQYKTFFSELSSDVYAMHPITKAFTNEQLQLASSRSLAAGAGQVPTMKTVELFSVNSGANYKLWGETRIGRKVKGMAEDDRDNRAPLWLAVLAGPKTVGETTFTTPRIVVIGDADMASNQLFYKGNNKSFILNTFNWALGQENVEMIPPRDYEFIKIDVSDELMTSINYMVVISVPGFILLFGLLVLVRRRA